MAIHRKKLSYVPKKKYPPADPSKKKNEANKGSTKSFTSSAALGKTQIKPLGRPPLQPVVKKSHKKKVKSPVRSTSSPLSKSPKSPLMPCGESHEKQNVGTFATPTKPVSEVPNYLGLQKAPNSMPSLVIRVDLDSPQLLYYSPTFLFNFESAENKRIEFFPYVLENQTKGVYFPHDHSCLQWLPSSCIFAPPVASSTSLTEGTSFSVSPSALANPSSLSPPMLMYVNCEGHCCLLPLNDTDCSEHARGTPFQRETPNDELSVLAPSAIAYKVKLLLQCWPRPLHHPHTQEGFSPHVEKSPSDRPATTVCSVPSSLESSSDATLQVIEWKRGNLAKDYDHLSLASCELPFGSKQATVSTETVAFTQQNPQRWQCIKAADVSLLYCATSWIERTEKKKEPLEPLSQILSPGSEKLLCTESPVDTAMDPAVREESLDNRSLSLFLRECCAVFGAHTSSSDVPFQGFLIPYVCRVSMFPSSPPNKNSPLIVVELANLALPFPEHLFVSHPTER